MRGQGGPSDEGVPRNGLRARKTGNGKGAVVKEGGEREKRTRNLFKKVLY